MLINRVYKPKCEETPLEISPVLRQRDLFWGAIINFEVYFLNEQAEGVLNDTLMNFHDWHLKWLSNSNLMLRWDSTFNVVFYFSWCLLSPWWPWRPLATTAMALLVATEATEVIMVATEVIMVATEATVATGVTVTVTALVMDVITDAEMEHRRSWRRWLQGYGSRECNCSWKKHRHRTRINQLKINTIVCLPRF